MGRDNAGTPFRPKIVCPPFFLMIRQPPSSPPFPYTTLFRSSCTGGRRGAAATSGPWGPGRGRPGPRWRPGGAGHTGGRTWGTLGGGGSVVGGYVAGPAAGR